MINITSSPKSVLNIYEIGTPAHLPRRSAESALSYTLRPSPSQRNPRILLDHPVFDNLLVLRSSMLAAPPFDLTFDDDSVWLPPSDLKARLHRTASVGNSWGVTSIGGGYSWSAKDRDSEHSDDRPIPSSGSFIEPESPNGTRSFERKVASESPVVNPSAPSRPLSFVSSRIAMPSHFALTHLQQSPTRQRRCLHDASLLVGCLSQLAMVDARKSFTEPHGKSRKLAYALSTFVICAETMAPFVAATRVTHYWPPLRGLHRATI